MDKRIKEIVNRFEEEARAEGEEIVTKLIEKYALDKEQARFYYEQVRKSR